MNFIYDKINFKYDVPTSYGLAFDGFFLKKFKKNIERKEMHSKESKIITDIVDEETDWCIFNDHEWNHLVDCWKHTKDKYFQYVKNKNVVITAGAHIGLYTRFYSKSFKTVYAFEPNPLSFYCMVNNNQTDNVIKIQAALNDKNGLIKLEGHSPMSYYIVENKNDGFIPCFTIDSLALEQCDLIQLDVERSEYKALKGGIDTITKFKPTIILENGDSEEIKNLFISLNYVMIDTVQYDHIWVHKDNS